MIPTDFLYGEEIKIQGMWNAGMIRGKVKDVPVYVVAITLGSKIEARQTNFRFGKPNRHLELEWGSFKNTASEFIVPATLLERI